MTTTSYQQTNDDGRPVRFILAAPAAISFERNSSGDLIAVRDDEQISVEDLGRAAVIHTPRHGVDAKRVLSFLADLGLVAVLYFVEGNNGNFHLEFETAGRDLLEAAERRGS